MNWAAVDRLVDTGGVRIEDNAVIAAGSYSSLLMLQLLLLLLLLLDACRLLGSTGQQLISSWIWAGCALKIMS